MIPSPKKAYPSGNRQYFTLGLAGSGQEVSSDSTWSRGFDKQMLIALQNRSIIGGRSDLGSAHDGMSGRFSYSEVVDRMLHIMEERYADPGLSLISIENQVHLSRRHLGRLFQRFTGRTFRQYLVDIRIGNALLLLRNGRQAIKAVAAMTGYLSRSHFHKEFRSRTGCTPAECVELHRCHREGVQHRELCGANVPFEHFEVPSGHSIVLHLCGKCSYNPGHVQIRS